MIHELAVPKLEEGRFASFLGTAIGDCIWPNRGDGGDSKHRTVIDAQVCDFGKTWFCRKFFNWQSLARKTELAYPANE
jgi:hypothetical protein